MKPQSKARLPKPTFTNGGITERLEMSFADSVKILNVQMRTKLLERETVEQSIERDWQHHAATYRGE